MAGTIIDELLHSDEPSVRWMVRTRVLGQPEDAPAIRALREDIRRSPRVQAMLSGLRAARPSTYAKWQGAHWVLVALAELGYPTGDGSLQREADEVLDTWLSPSAYREFAAPTKAAAYGREGIPVIDGRHRSHASQQGNALFSLTRLDLIDDARADALAERLLHWQWPDGGWNCDKRPEATMSSIFETVTPVRGLAAHAALRGDERARQGAERAAEVLLERRLVFRRSSGELIHPEFALLHYPLYWHYDLLAGLKAIADVGLIGDPRCADALDLLEAKRLPSGGWPAERRYWRRASADIVLYNEYVDWGGVAKSRPNPWVTADALYVLRCAGRL
jgi:hypothetical protein